MKEIAQERKTTFQIIELINKLRADSSQEISPDFLNEIGVTFLATEDTEERNLLEMVLINALQTESPDSQFVAYCHLMRADGKASEIAHTAIRLFQKSNNDIAEKAKEKLWLS